MGSSGSAVDEPFRRDTEAGELGGNESLAGGGEDLATTNLRMQSWIHIRLARNLSAPKLTLPRSPPKGQAKRRTTVENTVLTQRQTV